MDGGFTGWEDPRLGAALRRLALEAPSAETLLAAVLAASARATVRRRALAASVAAVTVVGVAVAVSASGTTAPGGPELVIGVPDDTATPSPDPAFGTPATTPPTDVPSPAPDVAPGMYGGRAVSAEGHPISGLYVYVIRPESGWGEAQLKDRTDQDGRFDVPCSDSLVVLNAFRIGLPQDGTTPNWWTSFVGGGHRLEQARPVTCTGERVGTTVPRGLLFYGGVSNPHGCDLARWRVTAQLGEPPLGDDVSGDVSFLQPGVAATIASDGQYRLAALGHDGSYRMGLVRDDGYRTSGNLDSFEMYSNDVGGGAYWVYLWFALPEEACPQPSGTPGTADSPPAESGVTASPEPSPASTPTPTPEPVAS